VKTVATAGWGFFIQPAVNPRVMAAASATPTTNSIGNNVLINCFQDVPEALLVVVFEVTSGSFFKGH